MLKKAILTGGGRATRLRPITTTLNKHLIPLANQPMIFYAIQKVVDAGITEIFINTNPEETELQKVVGDGSRWGIKIKYFEQEGGPQGVAHVVNCAKDFIGDDPFMFYLSDNIILGGLEPLIHKFKEEKYDCLLAFAVVPDPERFGVPVFDAERKLIDVIEKPATPPNNFAVTGIYLYGPKVFFEAFKHIEKSIRGEYEISDIHSYFLKNDYAVGWKEITGWWKDTGKPKDLISANQLLLDELPPEHFKLHGEVEKAALQGNVHVDPGVTIQNNVKIVGPTLIGKDCLLENCTIGPYVTIGAGTTVKNALIDNSIIFAHCVIESPLKISGSIIGEGAIITPNTTDDHHRLILGDHTLIET